MSAPFHLILAYPDNATTDYLAALVQSGGYNPSITVCTDLDTLYATAGESETNTVLITDLVWEGNDTSEVILSLALNNPRLAPLIISNHPVHEMVPAFYPFPVLHGFEDAATIFKALISHTEDLRGQNFGAYQIREFHGLTYMARAYTAYQPAIRREVLLNIQPANATDEERAAFRELVRAQAGNIHPNIYAIYEESEFNGRIFLSQEPVNAPTLFQLALQDFTFDARLLARVLNTTAATLHHMRSNGMAHQPLSAAHVTLSGEGVIKLLNTALPRSVPVPDEAAELANLAHFLRAFIPQNDPFDARLSTLLDRMSAPGSITLPEVVQESQGIDLALAPEKFVPQRQETLKAQVEVSRAKKASTYALISGTVLFTLATIFILYQVLFNYLLDVPATNFDQQCLIPAGQVKTKSGDAVEVKAFYLDQHETTIGQYEKFLADMEGRSTKDFLPPGWVGTKDNFQPVDWENILTSIKRKTFYPRVGEKLTRDHPIFGIDYADAYAFAKWSGKRLPTEAEWQRASGGDDAHPFPWGTETNRNFTNTGLDMNDDEGRNISAAGVDGFRGPAKVNEFRREIKDTSPFGVKYMAGNVSEWAQPTPEFGPLKEGSKPVRGGNFNTPALVPASFRIPQPDTAALPFIGLRCASDTLVGQQAN